MPDSKYTTPDNPFPNIFFMDIEIRLERIERKLEALTKQTRRRQWVKVGTISELTGWNYHRLARARANGEVEFKKEDGKFFYDLNSVNPVFIRTRTIANL